LGQAAPAVVAFAALLGGPHPHSRKIKG